jgi:hypothetical protein
MAPPPKSFGTVVGYIATRDRDEKFRAVMGNLYRTRPEKTECLGCMQPDPPDKVYGFCRQCKIRECVRSKGSYSCHQCNEWPCSMIENFVFAIGVRVMRRAIPLWREKVAEYGDVMGSVEWNGPNASDITVLPAANRSSGGSGLQRFKGSDSPFDGGRLTFKAQEYRFIV